MQRGMTAPVRLLAAALWMAAACEDGGPFDLGSSGQALVRGRVVFEDDSRPERVTVAVGDETTRTDARGNFEVRVSPGERRVRVDSDEIVGTESVLQLRDRQQVSLEIGMMHVRVIAIDDAERGGRLEGEDGFRLDLPERSLRRPDGEVARGRAELRYALVDTPELIRVVPELRAVAEDGSDQRLRSESLIEVRFYQEDTRLRFQGEARVEVPLPPQSRRRDGQSLETYHYDVDRGLWQREGRAEIEQRKWVARLERFSWWTVAEPVGEFACVRAELQRRDGSAAAGVRVVAEGTSLLWLSSAESDDEGQVCVEAPPDADLRLESFLDTGSEQSEWEAAVSTPDGQGMCDGDGCADLGVQRFKEAEPLPAVDGGSPGGDGGGTTGGGTSDASAMEGGIDAGSDGGGSTGGANDASADGAGATSGDSGSAMGGTDAGGGTSRMDASGVDAGGGDAGGTTGMDASAADAAPADAGGDAVAADAGMDARVDAAGTAVDTGVPDAAAEAATDAGSDADAVAFSQSARP